jgi:UDP-glucose 4-epimerase
MKLTDSPAGAYPSGKLGEEPRGKPGNLLPLLAQIAIGREKSNLKIFGNDYPTPYAHLPAHYGLS